MRAKSLRAVLRATLALVVVAGSMSLFNVQPASALDGAQFMCGVNAQKAYNDSKGGDRAAPYNALQSELARCRRLTSTEHQKAGF